MRVVSYFLLLFLIISCSTSKVDNEESTLLQWEKTEDLPLDYTRIGSYVLTNNSLAYLMPGKGNGRFSSAPEIITYSESLGWNQIGAYQGAATAGSSVYWQVDDQVVVVGGNSFSGAPLGGMEKMDLDGSNYIPLETVFPDGAVRINSFTQIGDVGYVQTHKLSSYHFLNMEWENIPLPNDFLAEDSIDNVLIVSVDHTIFVFNQNRTSTNFYSYQTEDQKWTQLTDFPGETRDFSNMVATENTIYVGFGHNNTNVLKDIWKYDLANNKWETFVEYPGKAFHSGIGFYYNGKLYFGAGSNTIIIGENGTPLNTEIYAIKEK